MRKKITYVGEVKNLVEVIPESVKPTTQSDLQKAIQIIDFGEENKFPQEIAALSRQSVTFRSILNSVVLYCSGVGFEADTDWIDEVQLWDKYRNLLLDYKLFGNSYLELVTDSKKSFLQIFHQDSTKVRVAKKGGFYLHPFWNDYYIDDTRAKYVSSYPLFEKSKDDGLMHSIVHVKDYEPEFKFYGIPNWYAGLKTAIIDSQINTWNKERLENAFSVDGILFIPGIDDVADAKKVDEKLATLKGAKNSGKLLPLYLKTLGTGEQREKAEFISVRKVDEGSWLRMSKLSVEQLLMIMNWYASLAGFPTPTGFDTQRIINDYKIAKTNVIDPTQTFWVKLFSKIMSDFGINSEGLSIINRTPIAEESPVKFIWEVRQEQGLEFNEDDPKQQEFYGTLNKAI